MKEQRGKKKEKDLSQLVGHKEGRSVSFGLHVSHVGCSGGIDMVGRKHLEGNEKKKKNNFLILRNESACSNEQLEHTAPTIPAMGAGVLSV